MPHESSNTAHDAANSASVLLVGWRSGSAQALRDLGCFVTVLCSSSQVAAASRSGLANRVIDAGVASDIESAILAVRRENLKLSEFDVICSGSEFTLIAASVLGELAGALSLPLATAVGLRDKMVQKSLVRSAGVRTAAAKTVTNLRTLTNIPPLGVVVKPLAGAGAAHTHHFRSETELAAFCEVEHSEVNLWLVEDYVAGSEVQIDGVVRDGQVIMVAVSRYLQNLIEVRDGGLVGAILLDPRDHRVLYQQAGELVTRSLAALSHRDGVFHLEAFIDEDGLVFSECAGRISGGMADESIRRMFGVDLHAEWSRALLRLPHGVTQSVPQVGAIGDVYLSTPAGRIVSLPTAADFSERRGVINCRIDLVVGDIVRHDDATGTDHRCATALVVGDDDEIVEVLMGDLADWFANECHVIYQVS